MYLTTPQGRDRLQGKKEELSEAEAHRDALGKEVNQMKKEVKSLGSQLSRVRPNHPHCLLGGHRTGLYDLLLQNKVWKQYLK